MSLKSEINTSENKNGDSVEEEDSMGYIDSGKCGDNAEYTIYNDGVLTISGKGDMWDFKYFYSNNKEYPWNPDMINSVVIKDGITSIGEHSFNSSILSSVTIPGSVKK